MVIAVTIVSMWMHTGRIHQTQIQGLCEYMTDASWAAWNKDDCVEPISCPYYCMCKRWTGSKWRLLESGKKPWAVRVGGEHGTWITRMKSPETEHFFYETKKNFKGTSHNVRRGLGWTFAEWVGREPAEEFFQT